MKDRLQRILSGRRKVRIDDNRFQRAAVLIPLFWKGKAPYLLLTQRTEEVPLHKGQISFPGGRQDPTDRDLLATALREAREELGVEERDVRILGELDDTCTLSDFCISPFVGQIPYPYAFRVNPREIKELIEIPLSALLDPANAREEMPGRSEKAPGAARSYKFGKYHIWGATARIITQLLDLWKGKEALCPPPADSGRSS